MGTGVLAEVGVGMEMAPAEVGREVEVEEDVDVEEDVELDEEDVDVDVVDGVGELVDTIPPTPSRTTPRDLLQQEGSLSQQKLPSLHFTMRGRKPVPVAVNLIS